VKLHYLISLFVLVAVITSSCRKTETPSSVAEKFLTEIGSKNFDAAKQYGTAETENLLNMMNGFKKISIDSTIKVVRYEITRETTNGENAIVYYKEDDKPGELPLAMVRVNGKWLVSLNKEAINNSDPAMDLGAVTLDSVKAK
jgi:hypothetical protein